MTRQLSMRTGRLLLASLGTAGCLLLAPDAARAHAPSNATLDLAVHGEVLEQRWDIALRDLDRVLVLDANDDGQITWGELRAAWPQVAAVADAGLHITAAGGAPCTADAAAEPRIDTHADGTYAVIERRWRCPADVSARGLVLDYRMFADSDASHRGLLQWRAAPGAAVTTAVLAPDAGPKVLAGVDDAGAAKPSSSFSGFVAEGIHHILIGTDHVLFLLALMLPAVLVAAPIAGGASGWRAALWRVAQVVTAFTVAHSITLALAGYADPPSRVIESLIAASVVLAAIDNLKRFLPGVRWRTGAPGAGVPAPPARRVIGRFGAAVRWPMAFVFGLVHGFGFAGALKELALEPAVLARSLVGFNVGVELGQLGIVAVVLPLAWWLRETRFYRRVVLAGGSMAIAAIATLWFVQRAFDVQLIT
jgi:hypothetical protein